MRYVRTLGQQFLEPLSEATTNKWELFSGGFVFPSQLSELRALFQNTFLEQHLIPYGLLGKTVTQTV